MWVYPQRQIQWILRSDNLEISSRFFAMLKVLIYSTKKSTVAINCSFEIAAS